MDIGALSLLISEKGFDATMAKVAALDAAAAKVSARVAELKVASPTAITVEAALARVGATASTISARPTTLTLTLTGAQQAEAALGAIEAEKKAVASPAVIPVTTTGIAAAEAGLVGIGEAKQKAAAPATLPITTTGVPAVTAALADIGAEKTQVAQPVAIPITTTGVAAAETGLAGVADAKQQAAGPVTVPVTTTGVTAATEALAGIDVEKAAIAQPLTIPVTPPNVAPAVAAFTALAEAEAIQESRAIALQTALETAGQEATSVAARVETLQAALAQDQAATDALSSATLQLDRVQRDGIEVIRLRARAVSELADAQAALSRQSNIGTTRVRDEPLPTGQRNNIAIGPELGPATAEAEALAKRMAATKAAFEAEAAAARDGAAALATNTQELRQNAAAQSQVGTTTQALSPKLRSAANGITAVAFAASSTTPNLQSMSLAAGLVGSSLAGAFGTATVAAYASGIGAVLALTGTAIGLWQRFTAASTAAASAAKRINAAPDLESAQRRYTQLTSTLEGLRAEYEKLAAQSLFTTTLSDAKRLSQLSSEIDAFEKAQQDAFATVQDRARAQRRAVAAAERDAAVSAANDQLAITSALIDRQDSLNQQGYALGLINLRDYFDARVEIARERSAAEIRALEAERKALAVAPTGEQPEDATARRARLASVNAEIEAAQTKQRTAEQAHLAERDAAERQLAQKLLGYEQQRLEAQGKTHEARLQQIEQEAAEYQRALAADPTKDPATKAALVTALRTALTAQENFNDAQREAARIFEELARAREAIEQRVARGQLSEQEGERAIATEERKRLPELQKIAAAMLAFATELKNPELINAAKQLNATLGNIAAGPLTGAEKLQRRFKEILDELQDRGTKTADAIGAALQKALQKQGGVADFKLDAFGAALADLGRDIDTQFATFGLRSGAVFAAGLTAGFSAAFTAHSDKNFFEAAGNVILQGLGNTLVQMGETLLTTGLALVGLLPALSNVFTSGPAMIVAGTLIAGAGAALGAIAVNNTGHRTAGSAGHAGSSQRVPDVAPRQVILDPDRRLKEARAVAPTVTPREGLKASATMQQFVYSPVILGTADPLAQRWVVDAFNKGKRRNIG